MQLWCLQHVLGHGVGRCIWTRHIYSLGYPAVLALLLRSATPLSITMLIADHWLPDGFGLVLN